MTNTYQIYLISDSTGETLDRIFTALKAQFKNINYKIHTYSFTRTENQISKILIDAEKEINTIILYYQNIFILSRLNKLICSCNCINKTRALIPNIHCWTSWNL